MDCSPAICMEERHWLLILFIHTQIGMEILPIPSQNCGHAVGYDIGHSHYQAETGVLQDEILHEASYIYYPN